MGLMGVDVGVTSAGIGGSAACEPLTSSSFSSNVFSNNPLDYSATQPAAPNLRYSKDSEPIPEDHDITGHRRLGQAVILQALADKATHWFFSSYSKQAFEFWCAVGVASGQVRRQAQQSKAMAAAQP